MLSHPLTQSVLWLWPRLFRATGFDPLSGAITLGLVNRVAQCVSQGVEPQTSQARNGITSGESTTISTVQTPQATVMGKLSLRQGSIVV